MVTVSSPPPQLSSSSPAPGGEDSDIKRMDDLLDKLKKNMVSFFYNCFIYFQFTFKKNSFELKLVYTRIFSMYQKKKIEKFHFFSNFINMRGNETSTFTRIH